MAERCETCGAFKTEVRGYSGEPDHFEYVCRNPNHTKKGRTDMADLNLNELRERAVALLTVSPRRVGKAKAMSDFALVASPPTVLALLDRVAELEAVVGRVEALADKWDEVANKWPYAVWHDSQKANARNLRAVLAGESDE